MTFNDSLHSTNTRKSAIKDDSVFGPVDDDIEDQDVEPTTNQERLFLAETWGVEEALISEFWELRKNPEARAAFTAKWGEEPEMDYFEDFIGQTAWTASEQRERDEEQEEAMRGIRNRLESPLSKYYRMPEWLLTKIRGAPEVLEALLNAPLERP